MRQRTATGAHGVLFFLAALPACVGQPPPGADAPPSPPAFETFEVEAPDGTPLVVDRHDPGDAAAIVLLFHQGGGSARGEYDFLVPSLLERGVEVWAPDLHGGGDRFGPPNRTLARTPEPAGFSYCDAATQLRAVVDAARETAAGRPLVLWGSSYSGALVLREAAARPEGLAGVLAFSPAGGGPMAACTGDAVAGDLSVPVLVVRPEGEAELESVAAQLARFAREGHETWVAVPGAHGSSTLNPERVEGDPAETVARVDAFLARVLPTAR